MKSIDVSALYEQAAELEAQALEQVRKYNYKDNRDEWIWWTAILMERTGFKHDILDAPTVEVVPVRKGKWINGYYCGSGTYYKRCDQCFAEIFEESFGESGFEVNFCPNCGAKMERSSE